MEDAPINERGTIVHTALKIIPAVGFWITSACFVLGLLIVNIRLAGFGISSSDFARTDYILSGAVLLSLTLVIEVSFGLINAAVEYVKRTYWEDKKFINGSFVVALGAALALLMLFLILSLITKQNADDMWKSMAFHMATLMSLWWICKDIYKTASTMIRVSQRGEGDAQKTLHGLQSILVYIPFLIFALIFYSHAVYPKISTAWGGGNKAAVLLYPTARGMEVCKTLALPIQKNQFAVGPLKVLTETEKEVVVLVPDGIANKEIAIRLNRELIEAIQSLSSNR